jgi:lipoate-protein ligase A
MILWRDGAHDAVENMRRDRALLDRADGEAHFEAVLRLFTFEPAGITLGHAQQPSRVLDLERCAADGILWAVRPTGGRAIFHAEEWSYALAARIDDPAWGGSLADAYDRVSRLLLASLGRLGVPARLAPGRREGDGASAACFASTARHELVLEGRKLVGSAQRRTARALIQQGSVLLGSGHERLADYAVGTSEAREAERARLARVATAGAHLGADRSLTRWASALAAELGAGVRRHDGGAGAFLLTPSKRDSYTSSVLDTP